MVLKLLLELGAERYAEQFAAKCHELGMVMKESAGPGRVPVPVTLQPSMISRGEFGTLCCMQPLWNEAVDNTARNFTFLRDALQETAASDVNFTGKLLNMLQEVYLSGGPFQQLMLGIFRTDYMREGVYDKMLSTTASRWKNVEINTISCSFAGLSPLITEFHQHIAAYLQVLQKARGKEDDDGVENMSWIWGKGNCRLERSVSGDVVPKAIADAVRAWVEQQKFASLRASWEQFQQNEVGSGEIHQLGVLDTAPVVLVVVQENERNTADQYALLMRVLEEHRIRFIFRTLQELHLSLKLHSISPEQPPLAVVDGHYPIAVAYFRSTYVPEDFPTDATWAARLSLERSSAIKCPSIPYHLLTFKKLQQLLCDVDRVLVPVAFCGDSDKAGLLQRHFVPQYSLNPKEVGEEAVEKVIHDVLQRPDQFVLKPQLEGGGNLLSGETMVKALKATKEGDPVMYSKVRCEYVVMSRIQFHVSTGSLLARGDVVQLERNMCSEVGIFGVILSGAKGSSVGTNGSSVLFNTFAGYTVRSKPADADDGGVMAGVAALDSLAVVP
ncbi:glutathione synthetase, putative [Trypanosoma brucei gambiense DAL972]|uniref:Glutathione synthetase n=2 Tax=Trypanosoma brucei TaxID=5691 RepID=C9ZSZ1_TRYB9|nr:glutathione synthetase, putative [Trypanosoma brucei gambiense DAL972]RHW71218.1 glutathione synthetase [Trypanosoma brucei equiperdum]CBH12526.1 glutathione synthetase, putative [Trypanosoma brucei gambiense DAL972]|eukprot:XP_011774806.1 glutathione synthetase, putative [Trypanosoma brucei gambiense DAL972]